MKKLICILLAACMLFALAACGETKPAEPEIREWTRQGAFEDDNGNHLFVKLSETQGYEGWGISLMLDGETEKEFANRILNDDVYMDAKNEIGGLINQFYEMLDERLEGNVENAYAKTRRLSTAESVLSRYSKS